ncbi:hypothetical protein SAMN00120144_1809 [Hymenobacter roseosalivarius DSM 11622]|uniref:Uncharacterized protein n=1 Tax=Hymenobacter roseosalivarius DSM 11622 TaxID=645990 RepID=A0A1W1VZQ7_9BACT|nr:hypothetical protein SAMN00120144_1809 [Hymenobacter roseosalivarius DSM 11622]
MEKHSNPARLKILVKEKRADMHQLLPYPTVNQQYTIGQHFWAYWPCQQVVAIGILLNYLLSVVKG